MNHLIIFAHPNTQSFNRAILDRVLDVSQQHGITTQVRDLYRLNFNPVLSWEELNAITQGIVAAEVKYEQQLITQAEFITLIYPLWWMGFPAILKGYLDRVLTYGFAYTQGETGNIGLLGDKKMQHFITLGNNVERYNDIGFSQSLDHCLVNGLFNYCGIQDIKHHLAGDIHLLDQLQRVALLDEIGVKMQQRLTQL